MAKILAPDWLSTPFLHLVGFFILRPTTTNSFRFFEVRFFNTVRRVVCAKSTWKSSAETITEIAKGEFLSLARNSKKLFVSKAINLDRICLVEKLWETEISHGDQVLSPRYFFQRTITEHNSVLTFDGRTGAGQIQWKKLLCKFLLRIHRLLDLSTVFLWFSSGRKLNNAGESIDA